MMDSSFTAPATRYLILISLQNVQYLVIKILFLKVLTSEKRGGLYLVHSIGLPVSYTVYSNTHTRYLLQCTCWYIVEIATRTRLD
jgi:hypothetical protein